MSLLKSQDLRVSEQLEVFGKAVNRRVNAHGDIESQSAADRKANRSSLNFDVQRCFELRQQSGQMLHVFVGSHHLIRNSDKHFSAFFNLGARP